jgi:transcription antitermination factor NusG
LDGLNRLSGLDGSLTVVSDSSLGGHWQSIRRLAPEDAVPQPPDGRWWVAHTKPRAEKALSRDLGRLGIVQYLPLLQRTSRAQRSGRVSRSIVPVFPGYLFFHASDTARRKALVTDRIVSTLEVADQQRLVRELRGIHAVLAGDAPFELAPRLERGDWARVTAGPLAGVEGVVLGPRGRLRLALNVEMLAQSVIVEIDRDLLQATERPR